MARIRNESEEAYLFHQLGFLHSRRFLLVVVVFKGAPLLDERVTTQVKLHIDIASERRNPTADIIPLL